MNRVKRKMELTNDLPLFRILAVGEFSFDGCEYVRNSIIWRNGRVSDHQMLHGNVGGRNCKDNRK